MTDQPKRPLSTPFNGREFHALISAVTDMAHNQLGLLAEPFTTDELAHLFCPPRHRKALEEVYQIEARSQAYGGIFVDLSSVLPVQENIFADAAQVIVKKAVLRIKFNRDTAPNGFITPTTLFGTLENPVKNYVGVASDDARVQFEERMAAIVRCMGEWSVVMWVLHGLQSSLRTAQQMRYVWPAIYTIASEAKLSIAGSLANTSLRAGINAVPDRKLLDFIRPTYEVVTNSVLLGTKPEYVNRYRIGQLSLHNCKFEVLTSVVNDIWEEIVDI